MFEHLNLHVYIAPRLYNAYKDRRCHQIPRTAVKDHCELHMGVVNKSGSSARTRSALNP